MVFLLLQGIIVLCMLSVVKTDPNSYMLAAVDKHRMAALTPGPRLFLIGGSSVAWGTDSKTIQEFYGGRVINFAYHAGHGIDYRLNEIRPYLREGDRVVVSIEYEELTSRDPSPPVLIRSLAVDAGSVAFVRFPQWKVVLDDGILAGLHELTVKLGKRLIEGTWVSWNPPYTRDSFNSFGDVVAHHDDDKRWKPVTVNYQLDRRALRNNLAAINTFVEDCRRQGIDVFYFFPAIPETVAEHNAGYLSELAESISTGISCKLLNDPFEMVFRDDLFYDTHYHLTKEGGKLRTQMLVCRLQESDAL